MAQGVTISNIRNIIYSILSVQDKVEDIYLYKNFIKLTAKDIEFKSIHKPIIDYIAQYIEKYDSVPSIPNVHDFFTDNQEVLEELTKITGFDPDNPKKTKVPFTGDNFQSLVDDLLDQQVKINIKNACVKIVEVANKGITLKESGREKLLKGNIDAVDYGFELLNKAVEPLEREEDFEKQNLFDTLETFKKKNEDITKIPFLVSGFKYFDDRCNGFHPKSFVIVCAYTSQLKSTMTLNMMYNQFFYQEANVEYICLEMTSVEMLSRFISIHSANKDAWKEGQIPLTYTEIFEYLNNLSKFNDERKERFFEVVKDLENRPGYFHFQDNDKNFTVNTIRKHCRKVELDNNIELDAVYIDHGELISHSYGSKSEQHTVKLGHTLMGLRKLSLNYAKGRGIRVIVPYQTSRDGYDRACNERINGAKGLYDLNALSWSSEAARSPVTILSVFYDNDCRFRNEAIVGILKHRGPGVGESFLLTTLLSYATLKYKGVYKKAEELDFGSSKDDYQRKTAQNYINGLTDSEQKRLNGSL